MITHCKGQGTASSQLDVSSGAEIYDSVQVCEIWVKLTLLPRIMMFCKGGKLNISNNTDTSKES